MQALIEAVRSGALDARIAVVISNKPSASGLDRARAAGIETLVIEHRGFATRDDFDRAVASALLDRGVHLVCLAGFMRLIGAPLLNAFPNAILNIISNHLDDAREQRVAADLLRLDDEPAGAVDCAADDLVAAFLGNRHRLAGDHGFVERGTTVDDRTVHRHLLARPHAQAVANLDGIK
jgi:hypothetical protein